MTAFFLVFFQLLTLVFMLIGLVGLIVPIFPGLPIIWFSALGYAIFSMLLGRMSGWDWFLFALISLLAAFGSVVDNIILAAKLRQTGTSWRSILLGMGAGLVSAFFLTPLAAFAVSPLALYGLEYLRLRDKKAALASTRAFLVGWGWTVAALLGIGALMIALWGLWVAF